MGFAVHAQLSPQASPHAAHGPGPRFSSAWGHQSLPWQCHSSTSLWPCLWSYLLDGPWTYTVGSSSPGWTPQTYTVAFFQSYLHPCLLHGLWTHVTAWSPFLFLTQSHFAPGCIPWMDPRPKSSLRGLSGVVNGLCYQYVVLTTRCNPRGTVPRWVGTAHCH